MMIHFGSGLDDLNAATLSTPTYSYAYNYGMIDGLLRLRSNGKTMPPGDSPGAR